MPGVDEKGDIGSGGGASGVLEVRRGQGGQYLLSGGEELLREEVEDRCRRYVYCDVILYGLVGWNLSHDTLIIICSLA